MSSPPKTVTTHTEHSAQVVRVSAPSSEPQDSLHHAEPEDSLQDESPALDDNMVVPAVMAAVSGHPKSPRVHAAPEAFEANGALDGQLETGTREAEYMKRHLGGELDA